LASHVNLMAHLATRKTDGEFGGLNQVIKLDGTIVGQFGTIEKQIGKFGTVNAIDCQEENDLLVGELGNRRVQRVTLRPM
jgi:hypothetical protein